MRQSVQIGTDRIMTVLGLKMNQDLTHEQIKAKIAAEMEIIIDDATKSAVFHTTSAMLKASTDMRKELLNQD